MVVSKGVAAAPCLSSVGVSSLSPRWGVLVGRGVGLSRLIAIVVVGRQVVLAVQLEEDVIVDKFASAVCAGLNESEVRKVVGKAVVERKVSLVVLSCGAEADALFTALLTPSMFRTKVRGSALAVAAQVKQETSVRPSIVGVRGDRVTVWLCKIEIGKTQNSDFCRK